MLFVEAPPKPVRERGGSREGVGWRGRKWLIQVRKWSGGENFGGWIVGLVVEKDGSNEEGDREKG